MINLLSVARVIGIVLLVILAVAVLFLFYPLSYKLDVDLDNKKVFLRVHWLFRMLRFHFRMEEEMELALSFLFFTIDFLDEEWRAKRRERRRKRGHNTEKVEEKSRLQQFFGYARSATHVISVMRDWQVMEEMMPLLQLFLFRVRPKDIHGCVEFGMKDPSQTGEITGAIAAIPYMYQTELQVIPDFETEETYISGDAHVSGHVLLFHVLLFFIGMIRRRNIRGFIGALRRNN